MKNYPSLKKVVSSLLVITLAFSLAGCTSAVASTPDEPTLPSLESGIDTSKTAEVESKDEVVYTLLSYDGSVQDAYVVNRFRLNSEGSFTDFGSYSSIENLTNTAEISSSADEISLASAEGDFYYQGTLKTPQLPWNITLEYTLDGKKIAASEVASLGGQSGQLGIKISTTPAEDIDQRFYEHYMLQISLTLPSHQIENLVAEGATIAAAGSDTQVSFVVLPGSEANLELTVDFEEINMPGISIAGAPYGMSFDLPDTSGMASELATLTNAIAQLSSGTQQINSGLAQAASGLATVAGYSSQVNSGLGALAGQGSTLASSSAQLSGNLAGASDVLTQYSGAIGAALAGTTLTVEEQTAIMTSLGGLSYISSGYAQLDAGVQAYTSGVSELASQYAGIDAGISASASGLGELSGGMNTLSSSTIQLATGTQNMPEEMQKQIDEFAAAYDFSGFEPASFVSEKNEKVQLVQFVFTTPALEPAEEIEDEEEIEPESSILDKLVALFTGE